jgi:hypothetical protein
VLVAVAPRVVVFAAEELAPVKIAAFETASFSHSSLADAALATLESASFSNAALAHSSLADAALATLESALGLRSSELAALLRALAYLLTSLAGHASAGPHSRLPALGAHAYL